MRRAISGIAATAAAIGIALALSVLHVSTVGAADVAVYKTPWCGCCGAWVDHLRQNGFSVTVTETEDLAAVKRQQNVPDDLQSCHTATVDGYVVEGHVPADDIRRLLAERPDAAGLAVPGMPLGSPGMEVDGRKEPYDVILFGPEGRSVFGRH